MPEELLNLTHFHSGKVRDTYEIPKHPNKLLMIASKRVSTHNVPHRTLLQDKDELLTAQMIFWTLNVLEGIPDHLRVWGHSIYKYVDRQPSDPRLHYHAVVVDRLQPDPREFIWRNRLTGSLETAYRINQDPYGLFLPPHLPKMYEFKPAIFTPTRKSKKDEPVLSTRARKQYPVQTELTGRVFRKMDEYLRTRGITLIDHKAETAGGVLIDEWGTGDCSRMAYTSEIREGFDPPWLDKEVFRQEAVRQWRGGPKVPLDFSPEIAKIGIGRYHEAFETITGMTLSDFQQTYMD